MGSWERVMAEYQISKYTEYNMRLVMTLDVKGEISVTSQVSGLSS